MTTMVLTMPRQMKGMSYVLLIAFLACFLPLGQFSTVIADDDRGWWETTVDVCKVVGGAVGAFASAKVVVAGVGTVLTTGWTGLGAAAGGGAIAGGSATFVISMDLAVKSANNLVDDIFGVD